MSTPSLSYLVQMGVIVFSAASVSRHLDPAIEPESSMRKTVSNVLRNVYGSSAPSVVLELLLAAGLTGVGGQSAAAVYGGGASPMSLNGLFMLGRFAGLLVDGVLLI